MNRALVRQAFRVGAAGAVLLLVATGCTGMARVQAGEAANVLGTVVMVGGFCGAAAANMPPCRVPDAPASGVELAFVAQGEAADSTTAGVDDAGFLAASLKPGTYEVRLAHPNLSLRLDSTSLVVAAGQITQISLRIAAMRP
jgi:hypothetical protein